MRRTYTLKVRLVLMVLCTVACAGFLAYLLAPIWPLPTPETLPAHTLAPSSLILDRNGRTLYEIIDPALGSHRPLTLDEIPLYLQQAVIATEDASFYRNPGVNPRGILRAVWLNVQQGEVVSGGSTITQQLARNLLIEPEERFRKSWLRKLREAILAFHLTRTLSKDEILALYLNEVYFGNMAYGADSAARSYLGKPVGELDLAECTLLAGLPQAPSLYNPLTNLAAAKERQRTVLDLMVRAGYITAAEADLAHAEPLHLASAPFGIEAPHFCMLVHEELLARLGEDTVRRGGLRVHTTLDLDLQRAAEDQVRYWLGELNKTTPGEPGHNVRNAAVLALDPQDGAVRIMVGSPDYFDQAIDGAVNATLTLRQPGSAIKPLTYAAAFERGYSPATMLTDVKVSFLTNEGAPYIPINYDYRYHGPVLLRQALACSYNVVAVKLLDRIGIDALTSMAYRLGITTLDRTQPYGLSLTLGGGEVQLIELTAAYGALANGGYRVYPWLVDYVETRDGEVLYRAEAMPRERVLDERIAYLVTDILADDSAREPAFGRGSPLEVGFPAAAKTGTTTEWRDNWTMGYTRQYVVGVWVGNADNKPMRRISGIDGAAPIWNAVMRTIHTRRPSAFPRPSGLVEATVCAESGELPGPACSHRRKDLFLAGHAPTTTCTLHRLVALDARTGEPAAADLPASQRVYRRVTYWPADALPWAEEQGLPLPPAAGPQPNTDAPGPDAETQGATGLTEQPYLTSPHPNGRFRIAPGLPPEHQQIEVVAVAPTSLGLDELTLWIDGVPVHDWPSPPYRTLWPLTPGEHTLHVTGVGQRGRTLSSEPLRISVVQ